MIADAQPYQVFGPLSPETHRALEADIEKRGVQVAVEVDENGEILDGHHRKQIADKLGLDYETEVRYFATEEEKIAHVIMLNLARRHLGPIEWGQAFGKLLATKGVDRGKGANQGELSATVAECAESLGVRARTARHRMKQADDFEALPDNLQAKVRDKRLKLTAAKKLVHREQMLADARARAADLAGLPAEIVHGDFRETTTKPESVDLIFCDPPYTEEFLPLYQDLSKFAQRVLRPGGWCLAYTATAFLPQIVSMMGEHLTYGWAFAIHHTGGCVRFFKLNIDNVWKPILGFYKPPLDAWWPPLADMVSGGREKDSHEWQQAAGEAAHYIEKLCPEPGVVLDPMCGSGTTCVAAVRCGRRTIGIEIEEDVAAVARSRVKDESERIAEQEKARSSA